MKLNAAQAVIINEIRAAQDSLVAGSQRLAKRAADLAEKLAAGLQDDNDTAGIAGLNADLAATVAERDAFITAARATGLGREFIATVVTGPFQYYWEGQEV